MLKRYLKFASRNPRNPRNLRKNPGDTLITRYVSDECTDRERHKIEVWLKADVKNRELLEELKFLWISSKRSPDFNADNDDFDAEGDWKALMDRIKLEEIIEVPEKRTCPETTDH